jgi:predicted kinase
MRSARAGAAVTIGLMAEVHLICGAVGAGKTTHARALARARGAPCFSIDDWMATLFSADAPAAPDLEWGLARTARCDAQIWSVTLQLVALGLDVVLDLGFLRRDHRDRFRALAAAAGVTVKLHLVEADVTTRRERVRARNRLRTETFSVEVSDEVFDWAEGWYEPPGPDEERVRPG